MNSSFNEKFLAYLALISGLIITAVGEYYSILGLTAIFSAAIIPVVIMGVALGLGKITATLWLKQNWDIAPWTIRVYLLISITILMFITSIGIFGFLSKAHSDQSLVSGDVQSKLAIYDEKIKTAKENIEADRQQLKQMDEAVDQIMARSTTEEGASRSNAIRKAQARDRSALAKNIEANQKLIATLNDEAAPIRAEIRKVEAEVGPIKYIAAFIYGETDKTILEKSVTWVIVIIIFVFDPLAVILLLSSQISFQQFRERNEAKQISEQITVSTEGDSPEKESDVVSTATVTEPFPVVDDFDISKHPYLFKVPETRHPPGVKPVGPQVYSYPIDTTSTSQTSTKDVNSLYVQNEEQIESNIWSTSTSNSITQQNYQAAVEQQLKEKELEEIIHAVKERRIQISDLPEYLQQTVKSRV